jgi:hypothetical protein
MGFLRAVYAGKQTRMMMMMMTTTTTAIIVLHKHDVCPIHPLTHSTPKNQKLAYQNLIRFRALPYGSFNTPSKEKITHDSYTPLSFLALDSFPFLPFIHRLCWNAEEHLHVYRE